ncbi:formate dehydrogenase accessory sulfurtransferase FdhD [Agromyces atrinae]|uniref:formate dehydrogenase accessory sulfurtransferase FdhD n=1 Tax=Agromyces atrinae TaxID=592376 RepID=UPI001F584F33|nr:formate dehydrogenase accessory sulfurtransferase FdhD [Agromyces atrinae]MCI2957689.1 formate dehydrogenase accessory sulfurtransferase FdhD [Agromyces atrinae]
MGRIMVRRQVTRVSVGGRSVSRSDVLAAEEPLEIRVGGRQLAVTMRTPGHDVELAAGFLVSEGVVAHAGDVAAARHCAGIDGENTYNVLDVTLGPGIAAPAPELSRSLYTTSSCGVCGKASIEAVETVSHFDVAGDPATLDLAALVGYPDLLRAEQSVFDKTGGLHAAALFAPDGSLVVAREDVGRHNAVDKVIGHALLADLLPLRGHTLVVSSRASFELVQKATMAGIPIFAAVSAPSSLAADLAEDRGITLVGFLRGESLVVYAHGERLVDSTAPALVAAP